MARLALPAIVSLLFNRVVTVSSVSVVGNAFDTTALAGAGLATTLANVTGFSVQVGLSSALQTLAGQAFGAGAYLALGVLYQRALLVIGASMLAVSAMWFCAEPLLLALGQDAGVAAAAASYLRFMLPGLWAQLVVVVTQAYLQSQRIFLPSAVASVVGAALHVPINLLLIYPLGMGFVGAAFATSVYFFNVLAVHVAYMVLIKPRDLERPVTWAGWSIPDALDVKACARFVGLAVPGLLMICEWWASEINIMLAGTLPESAVAVSSMSLYQVSNALAFMLPLGVSTAATTLVSNKLGAGEGAAASFSVRVSLQLGLSCASVTGSSLLLGRGVWPTLFTDDPDVIGLVRRLMLALAAYVVLDALCTVLKGVLQAAGMQRIGAPCVVIAYFCVGLPIGASLAFRAGLGVFGLVCGALAAKLVHFVLFSVAVWRVDWEEQAMLAHEGARQKCAAPFAGDSGEELGDDDRGCSEVELLLVRDVAMERKDGHVDATM